MMRGKMAIIAMVVAAVAVAAAAPMWWTCELGSAARSSPVEEQAERRWAQRPRR